MTSPRSCCPSGAGCRSRRLRDRAQAWLDNTGFHHRWIASGPLFALCPVCRRMRDDASESVWVLLRRALRPSMAWPDRRWHWAGLVARRLPRDVVAQSVKRMVAETTLPSDPPQVMSLPLRDYTERWFAQERQEEDADVPCLVDFTPGLRVLLPGTGNGTVLDPRDVDLPRVPDVAEQVPVRWDIEPVRWVSIAGLQIL